VLRHGAVTVKASVNQSPSLEAIVAPQWRGTFQDPSFVHLRQPCHDVDRHPRSGHAPAAPAFGRLAGAQQSVICGTPCPERWIASELRIAEPSDDILHKGINRVGGRRDACGGDSGLKLRRHLLGFIDRYRLNRAMKPRR